jgi:hypothetical protein
VNRPARDVCGEAGEQPAEAGNLSFRQTRPQSLVEGRDGREQTLELRFALGRQLDTVDASVLWIARPSDQPVRFHAVQVMGQRGTFYSYGLGQLSLGTVVHSLQRDEHKPRRQ